MFLFFGVHTNQQTHHLHTPIFIWISSPFPHGFQPFPPGSFDEKGRQNPWAFRAWSGEEGGTRRGPPTATKSGFLSCRPSFFFGGVAKHPTDNRPPFEI